MRASSGAPPACASTAAGEATPCPASHCSASAGSGMRRRKPPAAAAQRGGHPPGLVRDEDQVRPGRRLLERLQERVGGRGVHRFRRRDHRDLGAPAVARQVRPVGQPADALDADFGDGLGFLVLRLEEFEQRKVGMLARRHESAARARAAAKPVVARRFAQQAAREVERERALAHAARARDQQRVRPRRARAERVRRGRALPRQQFGPRRGDGREVVVGHQRSAARMPASSARTSATGRDESTTRMRCGSAAARSR